MSPSPTTPARNEALAPIAPDRRVFQWHDHASLWFSLGVGLLVMQVGAYLMPALGTREALVAIACGSIVGAGLLGWVAKLGCDSGLASAGLMHAVYGRTFASLPIILNIVQLVGWGTFELVVMRDAVIDGLVDNLMVNGVEVAAYVEAGFTKIHLDCSYPCADDPTPLPDEVMAARAARMLHRKIHHRGHVRVAPPRQRCCSAV